MIQFTKKALFTMMEREGPEWEEYYKIKREQYRKVLEASITYLAFDEDVLCGYIRCRDDDGFGIYIYDLLVDKKYRGRSYGKMLMDHVCVEFPDDTVYVMSDVDEYYKKQGYSREGSIFIVKE